MSLLVKVAPYSTSEYTSLIYAGLYELQASGELQVQFDASALPDGLTALPHFSTVHLKVEDLNTKEARNFAFDFLDGAEIISPELLANVDVYFKRSYRSAIVQQLNPQQSARVVPFGLHYACTSKGQSVRQRLEFLRAYNATLETRPSQTNSKFDSKALAKSTASLAFAKYWRYRCPSNLPPLIRELEASPDDASQQVVFYRTRVYAPNPGNAERGEVENENRVAVIRALQKEFGDRFIGGLRDTPFAREHYGDCIFPDDINWRQHIALMKKCEVSVTTAGLYDSTDWKLAEYLAASRCIVTEDLRYELAAPLNHDEHLLSFTTPEGCVTACDRILSDPALAKNLRRRAQSYYQQHLQPAQLMRQVLGIA